MELCDAMRILRKESKITQRELAESLGTTPQNISLYEKGERKPREEFIHLLVLFYHERGITSREAEKAYNELMQHLSIKAGNRIIWVEHDTGENTELTFDLLSKFQQLNNTGKQVAIDRVTELTEIKRYTD